MSGQLTETLEIDRFEFLLKQFKAVLPAIEELASLSAEKQREAMGLVTKFAMTIRGSKVKPEELEGFFKRPYHIMPATRKGDADEWYLLVPRFIDASFGYLDHQTESFNVFIINRYVEWLGGLPEELKRQLGWKTPLNLSLEGSVLKGSPEVLKEAWGKYRPFLSKQDKDGIVINQKTAFQLIASLVKDGILPFSPKPVPQDEIVDRPVKFALRDYQSEAWKEFLRYSNIGVFYPAGVGKTFLAMWVLTHVKGPHLVVAPSRLLVEQWEERLRLFTDLKLGMEAFVTTYQGAKKFMDRLWGSVTIDEAHHLPADQFVKLSFLKRKYTIGLSASPQREDGREHFIFALTGKPVGLGWEHFRKLGIIKSPILHVHLVKNFEGKLDSLRRLLTGDKKTVVFADSIEIGKTIAARFNAPHIHGETRDDRLKTIQEAAVAVVSRVGDEGMSLPDIDQVIEVDFLFGSRRQELQRFTRTLHSKQKEPEYHILMTGDEYLQYRKRLFSVMDKGFKVETIEEGVTQETLARRLRDSTPSPRILKPPVPADSPRPTEAAPPPPAAGELAGIFDLPGVKKLLAQMKPAEQRFWKLLAQNDGTFFPRVRLPLLLGYTSDDGMRSVIRFPEMVKRGWIEQGKQGKDLMYRTNIRSRAGL